MKRLSLWLLGWAFFLVVTSVEAADMICAQVIQNAVNPTTNECKSFPTPCDVPTGWKTTESCPVTSTGLVIRGTNLGSCKKYSDGCNEHVIENGKDTQTTNNQCIWEGIPQCLDTSTDTQIPGADTSVLKTDFKLKTFSSCTNMEDVMKKFLNDYYRLHPGGYRGGVMPLMMEDSMVGAKPAMPTTNEKSVNAPASGAGGQDYSATNIQVAGVDESEIVKTDGTNIFYYNSKDHFVYITDASDKTNPVVIKKIKIPDTFAAPELYLSGKKLAILSTKYDNRDYGYRFWFNRQSKSAVVIYDISDLKNLRIDRYFETDGAVMQSRVSWKYLYLLSNSNFAFPYDIYYGPMVKGTTNSMDNQKFDQDFSSDKIIPKKSELRKTDTVGEQNFSLKGKRLPYNLSSTSAASCTDIEYVLPDEETMKAFDFNPSLSVLSIINLEDSKESTKTKMLFGDVSEIHMSQTSLYIASRLSTSYDFKCGPLARCVMPYYNRGENTLIHKMSVNGNAVSYMNSTILTGSPLNQYSMDEDAGSNFRIVTHSYANTGSTNVFILDPKLQKLGSLMNIAPGENFQSARFMDNKLYLVSFQQIDPLFAIDLQDPKNPKILGELKIPGYSTYLHPYDATHLIGIGYDTKANQWGGTQNAGLKIDLYDVADMKNPKQLSSLVLGDQWSYSDVLSNPRLFVWNASQHLLFVPATIMTNANDPKEPYRNKDAWQGTIAVKITTGSGVQEEARITHIDRSGLESARNEECKKYANVDATPVCRKLIGGGEYCPPVQTYVPPYCYADSSVGEYFASQLWNYSNDFIARNLYLGSTLATISNNKIQLNTIGNGYGKTGSVELK